jgi:hypothetical protein
MNLSEEMISFTQLRVQRSWPRWLVQSELGAPDLVKPNAKKPGRVNRFYWLDRVEKAERSPIAAREIQLQRAARGRRALDKPELVEAAAGVDIKVKRMSLASLQVAAVELFYERNASLRRRSPAVFDAELLRRASIEYVLRNLVEWDLIFAGFERRATRDEAYFLVRDRVLEKIVEMYPLLSKYL